MDGRPLERFFYTNSARSNGICTKTCHSVERAVGDFGKVGYRENGHHSRANRDRYQYGSSKAAFTKAKVSFVYPQQVLNFSEGIFMAAREKPVR